MGIKSYKLTLIHGAGQRLIPKDEPVTLKGGNGNAIHARIGEIISAEVLPDGSVKVEYHIFPVTLN